MHRACFVANIDTNSFPSKAFRTFPTLSSIKSHKLPSPYPPIQGDMDGHVSFHVITYQVYLCRLSLSGVIRKPPVITTT